MIPKKVIIFDFDGTLVDSMSGFGGIAARVMDRHFACGPDWAREQYRETSGLPFPYQLERLFPGDPRNQQAAADFNDEKRASYALRPFYADVEPALAWLDKNGFLSAVSSNNSADLIENKLGSLASRFEMVLGFRPGFLKGKDHFTWICRKLGVSPPEMLFVGDSLHDARMAKACGIDFIGRIGTFSAADFQKQGIAKAVVKTLLELKEISVIVQSLVAPPLDVKRGWGGVKKVREEISLLRTVSDASCRYANCPPGRRARLKAQG